MRDIILAIVTLPSWEQAIQRTLMKAIGEGNSTAVRDLGISKVKDLYAQGKFSWQQSSEERDV